jgi:hypothetical protein
MATMLCRSIGMSDLARPRCLCGLAAQESGLAAAGRVNSVPRSKLRCVWGLLARLIAI